MEGGKKYFKKVIGIHFFNTFATRKNKISNKTIKK
jgi:hypothetical protein